jgi:hypothetical protein
MSGTSLLREFGDDAAQATPDPNFRAPRDALSRRAGPTPFKSPATPPLTAM